MPLWTAGFVADPPLPRLTAATNRAAEAVTLRTSTRPHIGLITATRRTKTARVGVGAGAGAGADPVNVNPLLHVGKGKEEERGEGSENFHGLIR